MCSGGDVIPAGCRWRWAKGLAVGEGNSMWVERWPVYRQLTGADALGRGKAAQSARSVGLEPRTASDG